MKEFDKFEPRKPFRKSRSKLVKSAGKPRLEWRRLRTQKPQRNSPETASV